MTPNALQSTAWLAKRLGLSVSTIERLRARGEGDLPPHLVIGRHTIRYDEATVERWLAARLNPAQVSPEPCAPKSPTTLKKRRFGNRVIETAA